MRYAFVAGYGIDCHLISQDINQLKSSESGYGLDETIASNCHVQTAFPPNRLRNRRASLKADWVGPTGY
jgi:type IV secretion system protein VirD4